MNKPTIALIILVLSFITTISGAQDNTLWYNKPAEKWMEALPVGNGRLGAMVFGQVEKETIQLNEESVWAGPPVPENREGAWKSIDKAREAIFNGDYLTSDSIMQADVLAPRIAPRSYQTLGNLNMDFLLTGEALNYRRELNLDKAIAKTTFTLNGVNYTREVFSSPVDQVIVVKLSADKPKSITVNLSLDRPADFEVAALGKNKIRMWGQASQKGKHLGVKYETQLLALPQGGKISGENGQINIADANSLTILISAATDYNKNDPYSPLTHDLSAVCSKDLKAVSKKTIEKITSDHLTEHQRLFRRVELNLGITKENNLPTNERLAAIKQGADDPELMALFFQYGRYLLISSSRPGNLPANLQGIWNKEMSAPWNADYHTNINFQMNYWPVEICNLSECHEPFFDLLEELVEPGQKTAKEVYNCDGFVVHHTTDVWHWTAPCGKVQYGMWPFGSAWCTQHFMEHYRFSGDKEFLANQAYPILKESCKFLLDWLSVDPRSGKLVSGPSTSPENKFYAPGTDKKFVNLDMGNAMDQEIIWDNFTNLLEAAKILEINDDFVSEITAALSNLALPKIGSDGRLMEWSQEFEEVDPGHRHLSHLFGLYPGKQFSVSQTPFMVDAINRSIDERLSKGGGHTGWSRAWIINFFARLQNSEKAYENLKALFQKSMADNLFDMHPPFQIDGNFGGTAGIAEMLVQSHLKDANGETIIQLLPALPSVWPKGDVSGLCTRGGFELAMKWNNGKVESATISSKKGGSCKVQVGDKTIDLNLKAGEKQTLREF
jgi:alpha-L-fucosidase 2